MGIRDYAARIWAVYWDVPLGLAGFLLCACGYPTIGILTVVYWLALIMTHNDVY